MAGRSRSTARRNRSAAGRNHSAAGRNRSATGSSRSAARRNRSAAGRNHSAAQFSDNYLCYCHFFILKIYFCQLKIIHYKNISRSFVVSAEIKDTAPIEINDWSRVGWYVTFLHVLKCFESRVSLSLL